MLFIKGPSNTINHFFNQSSKSKLKESNFKSESKESQKEQKDKFERQTINVQTRQGIEFGNWNIIR